MAESKYKLTYFNVKGIAEFIRYTFAYADIDFEDIRVKKEDWPAMKEKLPFRALPILEVDGIFLNQSVSMGRFLGKRFGLVAEDPFTEALLESIVDNIRDTQKNLMQIFKKGMETAVNETQEVIYYLLDRLEPLAAEGYLCGQKPTWVDIYFTGVFDKIADHMPDVLKNHPNLLGISNKIKSKDSVQKYIKNRPASDPSKYQISKKE